MLEFSRIKLLKLYFIYIDRKIRQVLFLYESLIYFCGPHEIKLCLGLICLMDSIVKQSSLDLLALNENFS